IPAAPALLAVTAQPPTGVAAGVGFGMKVTAKDAYGNVTTSYAGPVTVALAGGPGGTLGGTLTVNAVNGVATFAGLSLTQAGGGYTLRATAGGLTAPTRAASGVIPAAPALLAVTAQPPTGVAAGVGFGMKVTAKDAYGNVATS